MRKGWEYKKLGEVCDITMGQSPDGNSINEANGVEFHQGKTCFGERFLGVSPLYSNAPTKLAEAHSVLLCVRAPVGYPNITDRKICIGRGLCALYAKQEIDNTFLFYSLLGKQAYFEKNATGSTFKAISSKTVSNTTLSIPPKSTQLAIVSELDKINELIRLKKEQLKDFDNLAQSLFYEMFGDPVENEKGWEVKKLGEISSLICNGNTPKGGSEVYVDNGILFLRSQNVWKNRLDLDDVAFIDEATHKTLKKSALNHHDLLITKTGRVNTENSSLGRTALFEGEDGSANINGHVYLVRLKEGMVHKYVLYILISNSYRELIRRTCVGGIDKRQLNKNHIEDFPIILPPLPLQRLFAQRIEQIEREKSEVQKSIQDLETLLASRMQYWFE
ncbi:restriction endonuclease subunit S [Prevotella copri]|uniref:Restriction endonuclease subunit S n=1 Tax=Segatella copri TaxID=165179 RepID=A0A6I2TX27_9BACT|nr:restriction endonuclease subunit S [Segatella copri]MST76129.1 restriction endonuclease subunit S [Segatella copri]